MTCCVCKSALHDPSYRRIFSPANSSNSKIRDFFLNNICSPNYYRAAITSVSIFILHKCDDKVAPYSVQKFSPDGVFNYACTVLNDGLLLLELCDAIHEGDGLRIIRCWKFMLLHWRHAGHTKYAHEVVHLVCAVQATASPRLAHELVWCRTVNSRGGAGSNIPADLYLEHCQ